MVEWLRRWALELKVLSSSLPPVTKFLGSFSDDGCVRGLKISVNCPARKEQVRAMLTLASSVVIFRPQDPHENLLFRRCGIPGLSNKK